MEPLKEAFNQDFTDRLSQALLPAIGAAKAKSLTAVSNTAEWDELSLKQRMLVYVDWWAAHLPGSYPEQLETLLAVHEIFSGTLAHFAFPEFIGRYGTQDVAASFRAMEGMTPHSTAEFAIRPFLEQDPKGTLARVKKWTRHENEHLRRLASEGIRPFLPWGGTSNYMVAHPEASLEILSLLRLDPSAYVRKSVSNHLNDISKTHPELVLHTVEQWMSNDVQTHRMLKHACRTLLKAGHPEALRIFGYVHHPELSIDSLKLRTSALSIGADLIFDFEISNASKETVPARLEYKIHYFKSNGSQSGKVFFLKEMDLKSGQSKSLTKKQSFKDMSTRKHHPGPHKLEVIVNGVVLGGADFELHE